MNANQSALRRTASSPVSSPSVTGQFNADLSLFSGAVFWGVNVVVMKYTITIMNPWLFNGVRFIFSALALAACVFLQRRWSKPAQRTALVADGTVPAIAASKKPLSRSFFVALGTYMFMFGIAYQLLFLYGMRLTSATNTAIIMSTAPMWTAFIAILFLGERLSPVAWVGLLVSFAGTCAVALHPGHSDSGQLASATFYGNMIMLACAVAWAVSTVVSRPLMKSVSPLSLALAAVLTGLPVHLALAWFAGGESREIIWRPDIATAIIYSGTFSTGVALAMWSYGVKTLGAARAAVFQNLIPLIAVLCGWGFLGESPTAWQILGGIAIICGLLIMRRGRTEGHRVVEVA